MGSESRVPVQSGILGIAPSLQVTRQQKHSALSATACMQESRNVLSHLRPYTTGTLCIIAKNRNAMCVAQNGQPRHQPLARLTSARERSCDFCNCCAQRNASC